MYVLSLKRIVCICYIILITITLASCIPYIRTSDNSFKRNEKKLEYISENADPTTFYSKPITGTQSWGGLYSGGGHCSLDLGSDNVIPKSFMNNELIVPVALNSIDYMEGTCGMCIAIQVEGTNELLHGYVVDECVEGACSEKGALSLFLNGEMNREVTWMAEDCQFATDDDIKYTVERYDPYYLKIQVRDAKCPTHSMMLDYGDVQVEGKKTNDNFFEFTLQESSGFQFPVTLTLQSIFGDEIVDIIDVAEGNEGIAIGQEIRSPTVSQYESCSGEYIQGKIAASINEENQLEEPPSTQQKVNKKKISNRFLQESSFRQREIVKNSPEPSVTVPERPSTIGGESQFLPGIPRRPGD